MNDNANWEYGQEMIKLGFLDTLENWSNIKEYIYSTMDRVFDYLWEENNDGTLTFIDRAYMDREYTGLDEQAEMRKRNGELILNFNSEMEVIEWINKKQKEV